MRELRFRCEAACFRLLLALARLAPRRWLLALGSLAGGLGYLLDRRHRRIALENLAQTLGAEHEAHEIRRIARACWRHFGRVTLDTLCFPRFRRADLGRIVRYEGLEHIRAAYASGRGVLLFSGHFGHWELIALMQGFLDLPLALVTRPLDNPYLERLLAELRSRSGNRIVHKRHAVREMLKTLHARQGVAIVIDQDARRRGVFVPFLGRLASTTPTLAHLALRTGAAVVPVHSVPLPDGTYRVIYGPEVAVQPTGDLAADTLQVTGACTALLESWVRSRPELWLWMHRRWKTQPDPPADGSQAAGRVARGSRHALEDR